MIDKNNVLGTGRKTGEEDITDKVIIGLVEQIEIFGENSYEKVLARIDTGAANSSIDFHLASQLSIGPIVKVKFIKSSLGKDKRPVVKAKIKIRSFILNCEFTLADRSHMKYKVLIGRNILRKIPILIDPSKDSYID